MTSYKIELLIGLFKLVVFLLTSLYLGLLLIKIAFFLLDLNANEVENNKFKIWCTEVEFNYTINFKLSASIEGRWLNKLYLMEATPIKAALIIERAYKIYIEK